MSKREAVEDDDDGNITASQQQSMALVKRAKSGSEEVEKKDSSKTVVRSSEGAIIIQGPTRTSSLQAPTMLVTGHEGPVTSVAFAPGGAAFASGSFDQTVRLWNTFGPIGSYETLRGHKQAVLSVRWSCDGAYVMSSSADKTVCVWDSETGARVKRIRHHTHRVAEVDVCATRAELMCTAGEDGCLYTWDTRAMSRPQQECGFAQEDGDDEGETKKRTALLSCSFNRDGSLVFAAGLHGIIWAWDTRMSRSPIFQLNGHRDAVTSVSCSPDGSYCLSNGRDNTVRVWDSQPFSKRSNRCLKIYQGAQHNAEPNLIRASWSHDGTMVAAGSADRNVYVWDTTTRQVLYALPGHKGVVTQVVFHPEQPIILSAGFDKNMYLGEIEAN